MCCQRHGIAIHINRLFFKADVASRIGISATQNRVIHFERAITKFGFTVDFNQFYQILSGAGVRLTAAVARINKRSQPNVGKKPWTSGTDLPQQCLNYATREAVGFNSIVFYQILHLDAYCNECGNCATFCPHSGRPYKDKLTLFSLREDFDSSDNSGFYVENDTVLIRLDGKVIEGVIDREGMLEADVPEEVKAMIEKVLLSYSYLLGAVEE